MEVTICHVLVALHTACAVALYRLFPALYYHFFFARFRFSYRAVCIAQNLIFFFFFRFVVVKESGVLLVCE